MNYRFSIRKKMFMVILVPALVLVFVIYLDYRNIDALGQSAEQILAKNYKTIKAALQIRQALEDNLNRLLVKVFEDSGLDRFSPHPDRDIASILAVCRENITETGEEKMIDVLYDIYADYQARWPIIAAKTSLENNRDAEILTVIALTASLNAELNELIAINERAMEVAESKTRETADRTIRYSIGLLIAAIGFSFTLSLLLSVRISRPLSNLARIIAEIKEGGSEYPHIPITTNDEIGFLSSEFNHLFERLEAYDHRSVKRLMAEKMKVSQAEIAKATFIADLSHQLKTPMTSLSMSIGLLAEKRESLPPEKRTKLFHTANEECMRLGTLISELVDIAKLESMVRPRQKEILEIDRVVRETLRPLTHQAEAKGIRMEFSIAKDIPPVVMDSLRFPWVLTNLVGNAIRYTDRGGTVTFAAGKKGGRCHFQCIDTGSGIAPEFVPKIFDRYTQFSEREQSGTIGLGLAIVKEIIEQHGGDITVDSRPGKGTTFRFWIPIGDTKEKKQ